MARLGVFGGTFDPPHIGHLILAEEAYHQLHLDGLLWVLTPDPPHKLDKSITPLQHRFDMLAAAIHNNPHFELSAVEINRPGPHYSVDTIRILSEQKPGAEWIYLMGGDSLRDLPIWKNPFDLINLISVLGVMGRSGAATDIRDLDQKIPGLGAKVKFVDAPLIDISASDIRRRAAKGLPIRYYVPQDVYQIILDRGLYRADHRE
jgi:nicotinate-nucleotide adenylyltransferase